MPETRNTQSSWGQKPKRRPPRTPVLAGLGCLLGAGMLALGLLLGVIGAHVLPGLLNYQMTATVQTLRETQLAQTARANEDFARDSAYRATEASQHIAATRLALANEQALLEQTATQSARSLGATETAQAVQGAQQLTQIALDYQATQIRLLQEATRVEMDFQATRAAIGQPDPDPNADTAGDASAAAAPTQPTATRASGIDDRFRGGIRSSRWQVDQTDDWVVVETGVRANRDGARLTTQSTFGQRYTADFTFQPALVDQGRYQLFLSDSSAEGITLVVSARGLEVSEVNLYRTTGEGSSLIATRAVDALLVGDTRLTAAVQGEMLRVVLNGVTLYDGAVLAMPASGQIGVALPQGAILSRAQIIPED